GKRNVWSGIPLRLVLLTKNPRAKKIPLSPKRLAATILCLENHIPKSLLKAEANIKVRDLAVRPCVVNGLISFCTRKVYQHKRIFLTTSISPGHVFPKVRKYNR